MLVLFIGVIIDWIGDNAVNSIGFYWVRNARSRNEGRDRYVLTFTRKGYNGQKALIQRGPLGTDVALLRRNEWGAYGDIYLTAALSWRPAAMYFEDAILP